MKCEIIIPAFPVKNIATEEQYPGMDLRDYFAAKAMETLITSDVGHFLQPTNSKEVSSSMEWLSGVSYEMADAMLKARDME